MAYFDIFCGLVLSLIIVYSFVMICLSKGDIKELYKEIEELTTYTYKLEKRIEELEEILYNKHGK